jgi:predicted Zn-dependent peptidase
MMKPATRIAAAALLTFAVAASAAPCVAAGIAQQRGDLPKGGSYVLEPNPTIGAAAVGLWFRAPGAGYDNASPGIARLAATAAAVAPLSGGKSLFSLVDSVGGRLNINVYPDIIGVGATVPASAARRVVAAMTAAYFAPAIDASSVKTAQRDAAVNSVAQRYSADLTLHDLLFAQLFSAGPAHFPPLPDSIAAIAGVSASSVSDFAKRAFRSANAMLTLTGAVDATSLSAVTDGSGTSGMDAPFDSKLSGATGSIDANGAVPGKGFAWVGPPIADRKAATAMDFVADYLFRDGTGLVSRDVASQDAFVAGQFVTLHDPGVMIVTMGGDDQSKAERAVLDRLSAMTRPLDAGTFAAAREAFLYHLASDTQTPQSLADNLGWYAVEGNPSYAPGDASEEYQRTARSLDPQYVADAVRRYLSQPVSVKLLVPPTQPKGNAS